MIPHIFNRNEYAFVSYCDLSDDQHKEIWYIRNLPEIRMQMDVTSEFSLLDHYSFVKHLRERTDCVYYAVFRNDIYCGSVYLIDIKSGDVNTAEIGVFRNPKFTGKGVALEFVRLFMTVMSYAINQYRSRVKITNNVSYKFFLKLGFKQIYKTDTHLIFEYII